MRYQDLGYQTVDGHAPAHKVYEFLFINSIYEREASEEKKAQARRQRAQSARPPRPRRRY